jgi:hypothetical protein
MAFLSDSVSQLFKKYLIIVFTAASFIKIALFYSPIANMAV